MGPPTTVTGVVTRGRGDTGRRHWVTSYTISFSNDTVIWYYYKETNHVNPKVIMVARCSESVLKVLI